MGSETLDDVLDQSLAMADAGASIDDCVALHPQYADELRSHLELISMIRAAGPDIPMNVPGQATGRTRLLAAVDEKANEATNSPALGILVPVQWAFAYAGRLALPRALPAALIVLALTGTTLGALAATDTGGFRSAVTDAIRPSSTDDDQIGDNADGPIPGGDGGGGDGPGDLPLPGAVDVPGAPDAPPQPTALPIDMTATPTVPDHTPAAPINTPAAPTQTPANPTHTPAAPTLTPAAPSLTPAAPTLTPAAPTLTPAAPTLTPANPTHTPANPPDVLAGITGADAPTGDEAGQTGLVAGSDGPDHPHSADLPASPAQP